MNNKLSPHFSLSELIRSDVALRHGIDNIPAPQVIINLTELVRNILEPVRTHFHIAFSPSSGYRAPDVNRLIGSKETSQHILGQAVDFEIPTIANEELAKWIRDNLIYDQLILEFYHPNAPKSGWIHCSFSKGNNRRMSLIFNGSHYKEF